ncbi:MAG: general secretion pathway protein GspK [Puniceicoccales bacterium]|jgi:general secretion pathway protein K|nr:general secretion pathway protein GspK [Puniceicoccales bacterium]
MTTPKAPARRRSRRRTAAALILALVFLAFLAFIVAEIVAAASMRLVWENERGQHDELRREAFSALESTLGVLASFSRIDGALYGPAQGWGDPLAMAGHSAIGGVKVSVTLRDETGYYSLPALLADTFLLRRYFEDIGVGESQAQSLADCLADWTDEGEAARANGAERESYTEEIAPPNRPVQSLDELRLVQGFDEVFFEDGVGNDLWRLLTSSVTLVGASARPNINTAPRAVLEVLAERHNVDPDSVITARDSGTGAVSASGNSLVFRNAADLGRSGFPVAMAESVSFNCVRLRVITRASRGNTTFVLDTLLDVSGAAATTVSFPYTILQQRVNAFLQE